MQVWHSWPGDGDSMTTAWHNLLPHAGELRSCFLLWVLFTLASRVNGWRDWSLVHLALLGHLWQFSLPLQLVNSVAESRFIFYMWSSWPDSYGTVPSCWVVLMRALIVLLRLLCYVAGDTAFTLLIRHVWVVRLICIFLIMQLLLCLEFGYLVTHLNRLTPLEFAELLYGINRLIE